MNLRIASGRLFPIRKSMRSVSISVAKRRLGRLVEEVAAGTEITITKRGAPCARLVPVASLRTVRFGVLKGQIRCPDDFDAPMSAEVRARFKGRRRP